MNQVKLAAIYARVSSEQQTKNQTVSSQIEALMLRVKQDNLSLSDDMQFIDEGYSGSILVRPALERLRDCAYTGLIDRLYVLCPDRLARKYAYQVLLMEELTGAGIEIVFLDHAHGTTPEEQLFLQMQGMIAEYERAKIMERNRRGKLHNAKQGSVNVLAGAPYGYHYICKQRDGQPARYEVNFVEAKVVRQVFDWVGKDRLSINEVARRLQREGIKTKRGNNKWDRSVIWYWLRNPAYMGKAAFGKTKSGPFEPRVRPTKHGSTTPKRATTIHQQPKEEWIEIEVPAIISKELFQAVQLQLEENRKRARIGKRGATHLLQGLMECGHCGYAYYGQTMSTRQKKNGERYAYYRCIGADGHRFEDGQRCDNKPFRTERLDDIVWAQIQEVLKDPRRLEKEYNKRLEAYEKNEDKERDPNGLRKQISKLQQGTDRLIDSYTKCVITKAEFEPRLSNLRAKIKFLEVQLEEAKSHETTQLELCLIINQLEQFSQTVKDNLSETDFMTKRSIIRALVKKIEVYKDEVIVIFRIEPTGPTGGQQSAHTDKNSASSGTTSHFSQHCCNSSKVSVQEHTDFTDRTSPNPSSI